MEPGGYDLSGRLTHFSANRLELQKVNVSRDDAQLYYADAYHAGWRAFVDGQAIEIDTAHRAFKSINLATGTHNITLAFYDLQQDFMRWIVGLGGLLSLFWMTGLAVKR